MQLKDKKAIVTGGSQGIGKGIAIGLAQAGADVIIQYCTAKEKASKAIDEIKQLGRKAFAIQADFTENEAPEKFMREAVKEFGTFDILVNCAAGYDRAPLLEVNYHTFALMQKINVEVPLRLIQCFARYLIERKSAGSIINISSIASVKSTVGSSYISCTKASLDMLTQCAALELAQHQIRVNGIAPGMSETESNQPYMLEDPKEWERKVKTIPLGRAGQPRDYAGLAVFLASEASGWLTGVTIPFDGGAILNWQ
ncbi:MAG: glucose 1-dehydrogenase [Proteobacteria bacterium]|nr:glucose 1-dehydrogenase [Pseudomonadota bacterium]